VPKQIGGFHGIGSGSQTESEGTINPKPNPFPTLPSDFGRQSAFVSFSYQVPSSTPPSIPSPVEMEESGYLPETTNQTTSGSSPGAIPPDAVGYPQAQTGLVMKAGGDGGGVPAERQDGEGAEDTSRYQIPFNTIYATYQREPTEANYRTFTAAHEFSAKESEYYPTG